LLAGVRWHRRPALLAELRAHRRRQGSAHANQRDEPRERPGALPADQCIADGIGVAMLSRDEARNLVDRIFRMSKSPEMSVNLRWQQECNTRFANNQITTAGFTSDLRLDI